MTAVKKEEKDSSAKEEIKMKGKYLKAIGRRKTANAQIRYHRDGAGITIINGKKAADYFNKEQMEIFIQPLIQAGVEKTADVSVIVKGSGKKSQAEAVRHGLARVLVVDNKDLKPAMKAKGWITRDARKKERKKPGLKKARRAPQWAKR